MTVLILNEHEVEELLTMEECIAVMEDALAALARGEVHNPLRQAIRAPGAPGLLGLMPAWRTGGTPYYPLKHDGLSPGQPGIHASEAGTTALRQIELQAHHCQNRSASRTMIA